MEEPKTIKRRAPKLKHGTKITFSGDDLTALARYVSAGMVLLPEKHPVTARLKAALTRLGLPSPKGL